MNRFGQLLRLYRKQAHDLQRGGTLTQERLGELVGVELGAAGYTGAAVSDWERGKSQIDKDQRRVLVCLLKVLHQNGGIHTLMEADTFLLAGNYRPLDEQEARQIFTDGPERQATPEKPWNRLLVIFGIFSSPEELLHDLQLDLGQGSAGWTGRLLGGLGRLSDGWSSERTLRVLLWLGVWLLAWQSTFPLLRWPFANADQALWAAMAGALGLLVVPACVGVLVNTKDDEFWRAQNLEKALGLRFYTYLGAWIGFNLGYSTVFGAALAGYYLHIGTANWLSGLAAIWPLVLGYAAARQSPFNQWRAYGRLRIADGAIFLVFVPLGPLWAGFFYMYYDLFLNPLTGLVTIFGAIGSLALLMSWQRRRGNSIIPAYVWTAIFGLVAVLYEISHSQDVFWVAALAGFVATLVVLMARERIGATLQGGLALVVVLVLLIGMLSWNIWLGRVLTVLALLLWWFKGRQHLRLPLSLWVVAGAMAACFGLLQAGMMDSAQATGVFGAVTLVVFVVNVRN